MLASGRPLSETFEDLCNLLAQFVAGELAFLVIVDAGEPYLEYAYDCGLTLRDAHMLVAEGSQTRRVLANGNSIRISSTDELDVPTVPFRVPGGRNADTVSAVFVPLRVGQDILGVLSVQSNTPNAYTDDDTRLLEICALYVAVAVQADRIARRAAIDAVTGVATRRIFDERLQHDWARARREGTLISILMLDIDHFKLFNDTYGHIAGDTCLRQVAQAARGAIMRDADTFARYGGEEFATILWATDSAGAKEIAERMRSAIADLSIPHAETLIGKVTVSIGAASIKPTTGDSDSLLVAADHALYAAKASGRDCVFVDQN